MKRKLVGLGIISLFTIVAGVSIGSVFISPRDVIAIFGHRLFGVTLPEDVAPVSVAILWNLRLPRTLLAFLVGAAVSVSGAVMQSVLRNPLASPFMLGVSAGASLGAGLVILLGLTLPLASMFALPIVGFACGLAVMVLVLAIANRLDRRPDSHTIILTGMVMSLFINAIIMLLSALDREHIQRFIFWQMGSFAMRDWYPVWILAPLVALGTLFVTRFHAEMDMLTFGEQSALGRGVNAGRVKWILLMTAAALTGGAIAFVGIIGFVDVVVPHIVRRMTGASHRRVIPVTALLGGAFMVVCDILARTIAAPVELPVGAVTALLGAPFFVYIFFLRRKHSC